MAKRLLDLVIVLLSSGSTPPGRPPGAGR